MDVVHRPLATFVWLAREIVRHPANRGRRGRALLAFVQWQCRKRLLHRPRNLALPWGGVLRCPPESTAAGLMIYFSGRPEFDEMRFVEQYLRPGDCVLDIGANIGVYTLLCAQRVGPAGVVDAFEPGARARSWLQDNVRLNGFENVAVHADALWSSTGSVHLSVAGDTASRVVDAGGAEPANEVQCVRLDDVVADRRYGLAKIDVEGAEPIVLQGAERILGEANPPVLLLEVNGLLRNYGHTEVEFVAWLRARGYEVARLDATGKVVSFGAMAWRGVKNVAAVHSEWRDFFAARMEGWRILVEDSEVIGAARASA